MKIENIREKVTHDMKNLRKKNETETQNTVEGYSKWKTEYQSSKMK
jgi:hypothetical protein